MLAECAKLKADSLRLSCIKELVHRDALTETLADELSGDNSVEVRLQAVKALIDKGVPIAESRAKKALVIESQGRGLGGLFGGSRFDTDSSRFDEYRIYLLAKKALNELLMIEDASGPFDVDALLTAFRTYPKATGEELRSSLKDGFEGRFERHLVKIKGLIQENNPLTERAHSLKELSCLQHTRRGLDILVIEMKRRDLDLVREVIDRWEMEASWSVLTYLGRFGDWSDVGRILKLKPMTEPNRTLLTSERVGSDRGIGSALYRVGSGRVVDLLERIQASGVLVVVIKESSKKIFRRLSDEQLLQLMNRDDDNVRKVTAVKCLYALPKSRIKRLFEAYMEREDFRYYNVIHWLDLGVVMPQSYVHKIVRRELGR